MASPPPYHLTIRFSTLYADLDLDIPFPQKTTLIALKRIIRTRLHTRSRLRFIYHGRLLSELSALSTVIKPIATPPLAASGTPLPASSSSATLLGPLAYPDDANRKSKAKGKAVDRGPQISRIYINCAIGDELSAQDLAAEEAAAENPPEEPISSTTDPTPKRWQQMRPRGFDRLLQAGFTPSEISTLRTQFASIQSERFAHDAVPSPDTLRALEDSWIDSNAGQQVPAAGSGTSPILEDESSSMSARLDMTIQGLIVGFFFPLGTIIWCLRLDLSRATWLSFAGAGAIISLCLGCMMSVFGTR